MNNDTAPPPQPPKIILFKQNFKRIIYQREGSAISKQNLNEKIEFPHLTTTNYCNIPILYRKT